VGVWATRLAAGPQNNKAKASRETFVNFRVAAEYKELLCADIRKHLPKGAESRQGNHVPVSQRASFNRGEAETNQAIESRSRVQARDRAHATQN
jgi:hypothetical protein